MDFQTIYIDNVEILDKLLHGMQNQNINFLSLKNKKINTNKINFLWYQWLTNNLVTVYNSIPTQKETLEYIYRVSWMIIKIEL